MKATLFTIVAFALAAGILLSPAVANAVPVSNLVKIIAEKVCGSEAAYNNGCRAYMGSRLQFNKSKSDALTQAKKICDSTHPNKPDKKNRCYEGIQYLYGME